MGDGDKYGKKESAANENSVVDKLHISLDNIYSPFASERDTAMGA